MPLVEIELVGDAAPEPDLAAKLADGIGEALLARAGGTWVRLRATPLDHYAESGGPLDASIQPVFVTITERRWPDDVAEAIVAITRAVATATGRPQHSVHVIYAPEGAGRVAFGGAIVD